MGRGLLSSGVFGLRGLGFRVVFGLAVLEI